MKYIPYTYLFRIIFFMQVFCLLLFTAPAGNAQTPLLNDKVTSRLILQAMDSIYDLNFAAAGSIMEKIGKRIPGNPGFFLLQAFLIGQKDIPLRSGTAAYDQFEGLLQRTIEESTKLLDKNEDDVEGIFFSLAAHGYLALLYADNDKELKAAGEAKDAYDFIKLGFDLTGSFPDFYFYCGLYNYYREAYPKLHPYYKAVVWLFREGDKDLGLEMLKKGSETALFTRTEDLSYLGYIYLRYENDPKQALTYNEKLVRKYPHNLIYRVMYVENLLALKKCHQAYSSTDILRKSDKPYFQYIGEIFYGNYLETALSDLNGALNAYRIAKKIAGQNRVYDPHFDSILNLGLGRINKKMGNTKTATDYFRKAYEKAVYPAQKAEAESWLNR